MQKRTTTKQLQQVITNNLLRIIKAEIYHKSTRQTDEISVATFKDSLDFLCETIFVDSIGWYFERNHKTGDYEVDCSRMDGSSDIIVTVYLRVADGVDREDIERTLLFLEEE